MNILPTPSHLEVGRTRKLLVGAVAIAFGLAACGSPTDSNVPNTATGDASTAVETSADAGEICEVSPEHLAQFEEAEEPSALELDGLRNEVFSDMECLDDEVETVELADLSTLMYVPDGGFTWYPESRELANRGFAVSVGGGQLVKDIRDLSPNEV